MRPAVSVGWKRQLKEAANRERTIVRHVARVKKFEWFGGNIKRYTGQEWKKEMWKRSTTSSAEITSLS